MAEKSAKERSDSMLKAIAGRVLTSEIRAIVNKYPTACKRWARNGNKDFFIEFVMDVVEIGNGTRLCPNLPDMLADADDATKERLFDLFCASAAEEKKSSESTATPEEPGTPEEN